MLTKVQILYPGYCFQKISENTHLRLCLTFSWLTLKEIKSCWRSSPQTWAVAFWHARHNKQKSDGIFPATGLESVNIFPSLVSQYPRFPLLFFFSFWARLPPNKGSKKRVWVYAISPLRSMRYVCVCVAFVACVWQRLRGGSVTALNPWEWCQQHTNKPHYISSNKLHACQRKTGPHS